MKINIYEEDEEGNVIKLWLTPETPQETRLLDKINKRIKNFDPLMLWHISSWWETLENKEPKMLLKFPECWTKK